MGLKCIIISHQQHFRYYHKLSINILLVKFISLFGTEWWIKIQLAEWIDRRSLTSISIQISNIVQKYTDFLIPCFLYNSLLPYAIRRFYPILKAHEIIQRISEIDELFPVKSVPLSTTTLKFWKGNWMS